MNDIKWVLLAEDDEDLRVLMRKAIETQPAPFRVQTVEARDGFEAASKIGTRVFDCIVTDLNMPRKTGEEFLQLAQANAMNANTPIIVISGRIDETLGRRFAHLRMLPKPFQPDDIATALLQEVRLGRTDQRVASHLLPAFTEGVKAFLKESGSESFEVLEPRIKKEGESPLGSFHCNMVIHLGSAKSRLSLSFDGEFLEWLKTEVFHEKRAQLGYLGPETLARLACNAIFDHAAALLATEKGVQARLMGNSFVHDRHESEYDDLLRAKGIVVPFKTARGRVIAEALSKPRQKAPPAA